MVLTRPFFSLSLHDSLQMVFSKETSSSNKINIRSARPLRFLSVTAGIIVLLIVVLLGPKQTQAAPLLATPVDKHNVEYKRYCSNSLSDIMFSICGGKFNSIFDKTRKSLPSPPKYIHQVMPCAYTFRFLSLSLSFCINVNLGDWGSDSSLQSFSSDEEKAHFYVPSDSGPVHECCMRPCGYTELRLYCAD